MKPLSSSHSIDQLQYLQELISEYDQKLNMNIWSDFYNFISEEKYKCMHQLRKLKETEIEGIFMAKTSALVFPTTS